MESDVLVIAWVAAGYIGAVWLMLKGYFGQLVGCAIMAGGLPILLPAVAGPIFLIAAMVLPSKHAIS